MSGKGVDDDFPGPKPEWLLRADESRASSVDLSLVYSREHGPGYWQDVDKNLKEKDPGMPFKHSFHLCQWLWSTMTLTNLNLSSVNLGDNHLMNLAEALKANATVRTLNLVDNNLSAEKMEQFMDAIEPYNFTISTLLVDEGTKTREEKNRYQHSAWTNATVTDITQANEPEHVKFNRAKIRVEAFAKWNAKYIQPVRCFSNFLIAAKRGFCPTGLASFAFSKGSLR
jgi:hypothetical protein